MTKIVQPKQHEKRRQRAWLIITYNVRSYFCAKKKNTKESLKTTMLYAFAWKKSVVQMLHAIERENGSMFD